MLFMPLMFIFWKWFMFIAFMFKPFMFIFPDGFVAALVGVVAAKTGGTGNQFDVCGNGGNPNDCGGGGGGKRLWFMFKFRGEIGGEIIPLVFNKNGAAAAFSEPLWSPLFPLLSLFPSFLPSLSLPLFLSNLPLLSLSLFLSCLALPLLVFFNIAAGIFKFPLADNMDTDGVLPCGDVAFIDN